MAKSKLPMDTVVYQGELYIQRYIPETDPKKLGRLKTVWSPAKQDREWLEAENKALEAANIFIQDLTERGEL